MGIFKEFKDFAFKGNVIDLAVAVVIGTAFNSVISSLVEDIIMPPIGYLIGRVNFSELQYVLYTNGETVAVRYGSFIQTLVDFLIIAFSVFIAIKIFNKLTTKKK